MSAREPSDALSSLTPSVFASSSSLVSNGSFNLLVSQPRERQLSGKTEDRITNLFFWDPSSLLAAPALTAFLGILLADRGAFSHMRD